MNSASIDTFLIENRLVSQKLIDVGSTRPVDVVRHMLCVQSQDLTQAKRAIAVRAGCTQQDIVDDFNTGKIVRTWTQRGTIHTICTEDVGWMTKLCASKTLGGFKKRREYLGISDILIDKMQLHVVEFLKQGPQTRKTIGEHLAHMGIDMQPNWLYHILCYLGTQGILVQGPFLGNEHAFVLMDQWSTSHQPISGDEAVTHLVHRYLIGHGPATITDLQWRSGIGSTQIKYGIEQCGPHLCFHNGYYTTSAYETLSPNQQRVHFLPGFDEWLLGYKDRSATLDYTHATKIDASSNGVFKPTVMINGKTMGIWSIKHKAKRDEVVVTGFSQLTQQECLLFEEAIDVYQSYVEKKIHIIFTH